MAYTLKHPSGETGYLPNFCNLAEALGYKLSARKIAPLLSQISGAPVTNSTSSLDKMSTTGVGKIAWQRFEQLMIECASTIEIQGPFQPIGSHDSHIDWRIIINTLRKQMKLEHGAFYFLDYIEHRCQVHQKAMQLPNRTISDRLNTFRRFLPQTGLTEQEQKEAYLALKDKVGSYELGMSRDKLTSNKGLAIERFELDFYLMLLCAVEITIDRDIAADILEQGKATYWQCFLDYLLHHSTQKGTVSKMAQAVPVSGNYIDPEQRKQAKKNKLNKWRKGIDLPSCKATTIFLTKLKAEELTIYAYLCRHLDKLKSSGKWQHWDQIVTSESIRRYRYVMNQDKQ